MAQEIIDTLEMEEQEVQTKDGAWYLMRLLPYRTEGNTPDGVVITFVDITSRKQAEEKIISVAEDAKSKAHRLEDILKLLARVRSN